MRIGKRLILSFLAIALIVGIVGHISIKSSQNELQKSIGENSSKLAAEILDRMDRSIYGRIEEFQAYAKDIILQETLIKSNQEFNQLYNIQAYIAEKDAEWTSAPKDALTPFMQELIDNRLSEKLREKIEFYEEKYGYKVFGEAFVTNKYGANAGLTGKTFDYRQADEEWWQNAKKDGLYVGDIEYDRSADVYSTDICVSINDKAGNFLGIIKAVLNIEEVIRILKELKSDEIDEKHKAQGHESHAIAEYELLTKDGKIIYSTEEFNLFQNIYDQKIARFGAITSPEHRSCFIGPADTPGEKGEELFTHAHSRGYREFKGLGWILIIEQKTNEIFARVIKLRNLLLTISLAAVILAILTGFFISLSISKPITKLRDAVVEIGKGKLGVKVEIKSKDEIGILANTFNKMTEHLQNTTVSRDYVDNIISGMADILVVVTPDGKIEKANKAALDILGYNEHELIGKDASLLFSEEEKRRLPLKGTKLDKLIKKGTLKGYEIDFRTKDGKKIPVLLSSAIIKAIDCPHEGPAEDCPSYREKGKHCEKILSIVCVAKDITERKRAKEALKKAEERYRVLFTSSRDAIMTLAPPEWKFTSGNIATIKMFNAKDEKDFFSKAPWQYSPEYQPDGMASSEKAIEMINKAMKEGSSFFEWTHKKLTGEEFPATVLLTRIEIEEKQFLQATVRDITERKKLEEELENHRERLEKLVEERTKKLKEIQSQLIQAEKMEAIGKMASGIAHEVKNPLGIILQGADYLKGKLPPTEKTMLEVLKMMEDNIERANEIISALVDFSRPTELKLKPEDINSILETSMALVRHRFRLENIEVVKELENNLPKVLADKGKIEQIFINLFLNSMQAMPQGGKLFIRTRQMRLGKMHRAGKRKSDEDYFEPGETAVEVEVEDTGTGISKDNLKKVFDPFFSTKALGKGTGLGLSVVENIIDMHKGLVNIESKERVGTKVNIILKIGKGRQNENKRR